MFTFRVDSENKTFRQSQNDLIRNIRSYLGWDCEDMQ